MGIYRIALEARIEFKNRISEIYYRKKKISRRHQEILVEIVHQLSNHFVNSSYTLLSGPVEIDFGKFTSDVSITTYPDIAVILDPKKLSERGVIGPPEWIIEISYPETALSNIREKLYLYENRGVREYWIVDQQNRLVHGYHSVEEGRYGKPRICGRNETLTSRVLPRCRVDFSRVFR